MNKEYHDLTVQRGLLSGATLQGDGKLMITKGILTGVDEKPRVFCFILAKIGSKRCMHK